MFKTKNLKFQNIINYNDIHIKKGKITFISGPSGSGKSTLLKLLNKTANFSDGHIFYKDKDIKTYDSITLRKEAKLISQTAFLFPDTIENNFKLFYEYCNYKQEPTVEIMRKFLSLTEGNFELSLMCDTLSGGEKQRVYIAICLSMEADVIMLDEPTSALDSEISNKFMLNIIDYCKQNKKTLIVVSHNQDIVEKFAEDVITI